MTGVPEQVWPKNLRLCLAGLGQQASPLQAVWIGALLQCHVDHVFFGTTNLDPMECLHSIRGRVLVIAEHLDFQLPARPSIPEPPVDLHTNPNVDDHTRAPWARFRHLGGPTDATVIHYLDEVPFVMSLLLRSSMPPVSSWGILMPIVMWLTAPLVCPCTLAPLLLACACGLVVGLSSLSLRLMSQFPPLCLGLLSLLDLPLMLLLVRA